MEKVHAYNLLENTVSAGAEDATESETGQQGNVRNDAADPQETMNTNFTELYQQQQRQEQQRQEQQPQEQQPQEQQPQEQQPQSVDHLLLWRSSSASSIRPSPTAYPVPDRQHALYQQPQRLALPVKSPLSLSQTQEPVSRGSLASTSSSTWPRATTNPSFPPPRPPPRYMMHHPQHPAFAGNSHRLSSSYQQPPGFMQVEPFRRSAVHSSQRKRSRNEQQTSIASPVDVEPSSQIAQWRAPFFPSDYVLYHESDGARLDSFAQHSHQFPNSSPTSTGSSHFDQSQFTLPPLSSSTSSSPPSLSSSTRLSRSMSTASLPSSAAAASLSSSATASSSSSSSFFSSSASSSAASSSAASSSAASSEAAKPPKRSRKKSTSSSPGDGYQNLYNNNNNNNNNNRSAYWTNAKPHTGSKPSSSSSRFVGVYYDRASRKYQSHISTHGHQQRLGSFSDEVYAALVRDKAELRHGQNRTKAGTGNRRLSLNFPYEEVTSLLLKAIQLDQAKQDDEALALMELARQKCEQLEKAGKLCDHSDLVSTSMGLGTDMPDTRSSNISAPTTTASSSFSSSSSSSSVSSSSLNLHSTTATGSNASILGDEGKSTQSPSSMTVQNIAVLPISASSAAEAAAATAAATTTTAAATTTTKTATKTKSSSSTESSLGDQLAACKPSVYKGVYYDEQKTSKKYIVVCERNNKFVQLSACDSEIMGALVRDKYDISIGDTDSLNFPNMRTRLLKVLDLENSGKLATDSQEKLAEMESECAKLRRKSRVSGNSSFVGVNYSREHGRYRAYVKVQQKVIHLGYFDDEVLAALARDKFDLKRDPNTKLNLPQSIAYLSESIGLDQQGRHAEAEAKVELARQIVHL